MGCAGRFVVERAGNDSLLAYGKLEVHAAGVHAFRGQRKDAQRHPFHRGRLLVGHLGRRDSDLRRVVVVLVCRTVLLAVDVDHVVLVVDIAARSVAVVDRVRPAVGDPTRNGRGGGPSATSVRDGSSGGWDVPDTRVAEDDRRADDMRRDALGGGTPGGRVPGGRPATGGLTPGAIGCVVTGGLVPGGLTPGPAPVVRGHRLRVLPAPSPLPGRAGS